MIVQFQVGGFDDNFSYLVVDEKKKTAAVVDPAGNLEELFAYIEEHGLTLASILVTHSHFDHIEGIPEILKKHSATLYVHKHAEKRINRLPEKVTFVEEGDEISVGDLKLEVFHTPGHIDDAVCYYLKKDGEHLLTGDTLFVEGCGRTNKMDAEELYKSLERLKRMNKKTQVYPGHDYGSMPISTIEHELAHNRFFLVSDYDAFLKERFPT